MLDYTGSLDSRSDHPGKHIFIITIRAGILPVYLLNIRHIVIYIAHELEMYNGCDKKKTN